MFYFFHLHKAGGSTFLNLAEANHSFFPQPSHCGQPGIPTLNGWSTSLDLQILTVPYWEFWKLPPEETHKVHQGIAQMRTAGVNFIAQEYGHFEPSFWEDFVKVACVRHPIDRIYSDFHHTRMIGRKLPTDLEFFDWVENLAPKPFAPNLLLEQMGRGDEMLARENLAKFDVIIDQANYAATVAVMAEYGWTELDPEKHYKSWAPRRQETGREVLRVCPEALEKLSRLCAADIRLYEYAQELIQVRLNALLPQAEAT